MLNIKRGLQCSMLVGFKNAERFTVQYLGWCWICGEVYSAVFWLALNIQRGITVQQFGRCWKCVEVYSAEFWKALKMRKGFTVQYFGDESAERFTVQYLGRRWICSKFYSAVFWLALNVLVYSAAFVLQENLRDILAGASNDRTKKTFPFQSTI